MPVIPIDTCICRLMPIFFIYWFYSYFVRVLILVLFIIALFVMILLIWSCRKYFVILWHHSILVIALNKLFVSARCLHKSRILLIVKTFTSKKAMISDVIVRKSYDVEVKIIFVALHLKKSIFLRICFFLFQNVHWITNLYQKQITPKCSEALALSTGITVTIQIN